MADLSLHDVFTPAEVARATGVDVRDVVSLVDSGEIAALPLTGRTVYLSHAEAVRAGRILIEVDRGSLRFGRAAGSVLFATDRSPHGWLDRPVRARAPFAISSVVHAALLAVVALATASMGAAAPARTTLTNTRLVYLVSPGPGGGGGGGGARKPLPAAAARRKGTRALSSPIPARQVPVAVAPPAATPAPMPVEAPVVTAPADNEEKVGVLEEPPAPSASEGPGAGTGAGAGAGAGAGDGLGDGVGDGDGGGTGGGPYRPGSGVEPPRVLREVKPLYTETARQRGIQGDVLLEIVVRRDGSVGDVRILQGLGHGLDQRAVEAVRQWRFAPARRLGADVDVMVEVAMEFRLR
jgi:TonB family protein